jgi:hypothetical protein
MKRNIALLSLSVLVGAVALPAAKAQQINGTLGSPARWLLRQAERGLPDR